MRSPIGSVGGYGVLSPSNHTFPRLGTNIAPDQPCPMPTAPAIATTGHPMGHDLDHTHVRALAPSGPRIGTGMPKTERGGEAVRGWQGGRGGKGGGVHGQHILRKKDSQVCSFSGSRSLPVFLGFPQYLTSTSSLTRATPARRRTQRQPHITTMQLKAYLAAAAAAQLASAQELMRFGCSQLTIDRIDPLVNPGSLPSPHMHQIIGGNSFNVSMTPGSLDPPTTSTCTSCTYSEDFSNYWTANVYFKARNGTYKRVPQVANLGLGVQAGMTVY